MTEILLTGTLTLTLKTPAKKFIINSVCLLRLLQNFAKHYLTKLRIETVWTQIRLQSDLHLHCLLEWLLKLSADDKSRQRLL